MIITLFCHKESEDKVRILGFFWISSNHDRNRGNHIYTYTVGAFHLTGIFGNSGENSNATVNLGGMFSEKNQYLSRYSIFIAFTDVLLHSAENSHGSFQLNGKAPSLCLHFSLARPVCQSINKWKDSTPYKLLLHWHEDIPSHFPSGDILNPSRHLHVGVFGIKGSTTQTELFVHWK